MQNIGADNAGDAFYRYKMPRLVAKIEGRGNGIKTNIVNCVDIAKSLERPPEYVLKYFGCELGAQTNFDAKIGTCIVNGAHEAPKLSEVLEGFIKRYVQCHSCGNPETVVKIRKDFIHLKCKACGFLSDVDMRHKLNTFILKNPPENKLNKAESKLKKLEEDNSLVLKDEKAPKEEKKVKKEKSKDKDKPKEKDKKDKKKKKDEAEADKDEENVEEEEAEDDGVVWMTDTSAEAIKRRAEEQLSAATAALVTVGNIEAEQEAARKRAEKEAQRKAEEEEAQRQAEEEERKRVEAEAAAALAEELARQAVIAENTPVKRLRRTLASEGAAAAVAEARALSVEGGLPGKMSVLYEAVFGASEEKLADVLKAQKDVFAPFSKDPAGQLAQLIALERLVAVVSPERVKETALILKAMYDMDLADDEVIIGWHGKEDAGSILGVPPQGAKLVRKYAAPLVEWLQQEEDEDDDDEEEEEEDEDA